MARVLTAATLLEHGFRHGFSLREGGCSGAPFDTLNLGRSVGDDPAAVEENHRLFAAAVGFEPPRLLQASQVHGARALAVEAGTDADALRGQEADALVAAAGGLPVGVRVADCLPLLIADPHSGVAAAVHSGWRGTVAGVVEAALAVMLDSGAGHPSDYLAAIFPHIGSCCFEVGPDVAEELREASPDPEVVDRSRARPHVDLAAIVTAKLVHGGLRAGRIERVAGCTRCEPKRFFSYRRDGRRSGRHVAAIVSA